MFKIYITGAFLCIASTVKAYTPLDSVGVENFKGKKVILHKVESKQTYYALGQRYGVDYKEIIKFNNNAALKYNSIVKVPTQIDFAEHGNSRQSTAAVAQFSPTKGKIVEHAVEKGESLYGLAKRYGMTEAEVKQLNQLKSARLSIGQTLRFYTPQAENTNAQPQHQAANTAPAAVVKQTPVATNQKIEEKIVTNVAVKSEPAATPVKSTATANVKKILIHTVQNNETLYSIATQYKTTMNELIADNGIQNYQVNIGQDIYIYGSEAEYNQQNKPGNAVSSTTNADGDVVLVDPKLRKDASVYGLSQVDEDGTALWIEDKDLDNTKMLVLHRNAPIGTVIRVTNPMTNRSTFAKVVGSFAETENTKNIIILMTKAVANALGARDKKFHCTINYGIQKDESE